MAQEKKESSYKDEDYDVVLENESCVSETLRIIATIILTAVVVSGIGYIAHIYIVDKSENDLQSQINRLESRVIAEIRAARGGDESLGQVQELEVKLQEAENIRIELENKIILLSQEQATSSEEESIEDSELMEDQEL